MASMAARASRFNLDTTKNYCMVRGSDVTFVGTFVRAYRMGSGDGMTVHWEFMNNGKVIYVDDEMWGSVGGAELVGFVEVC